MNRRNFLNLIFVLSIPVFFCFPSLALSQTIPNSFFHDASTILPYAHLRVFLEDGQTRMVPFTPVVIGKSPSGIRDYSNDISVQGAIIFAGNGIVSSEPDYNSYKSRNIQGEIPIIVYNYPFDYQSRIGEKSDLHMRAYEAEVRGAIAIIIFGLPEQAGWNAPFIELPETYPPVNIPILSISFNAAKDLLEAGGLEIYANGRSMAELLETVPLELLIRAHINVKGNFEKVSSPNFFAEYLPGILNNKRMVAFVNDEEKALAFTKNFLRLGGLDFKKSEITYFPDYTSLRFYTNITGDSYHESKDRFKVFSIIETLEHPIREENYHIARDVALSVLNQSWGEGDYHFTAGLAAMIGGFAAGEATVDLNRITADLLISDDAIPLAEIFRISKNEKTAGEALLQIETGSFLKFLLANYSFEKIISLFQKLSRAENAKEKIELFDDDLYLKDFKFLQRGWVEQLAFKYGINSEITNPFLAKSESIIEEILSGKN